MALPPPEERFCENINGVIETVTFGVQEAQRKGHSIISPLLLSLAGAAIAQYDKRFIIETFINKSHEHWDKIRAHNRNFFIENAADIFSDLPLGNVEAFKKLFTLRDGDGKPIAGEEFEDELWSTFESLVKICVNYIHENREMDASGEYAYEFFEHVDLERHAKTWGMNLKPKK